MGLGLSGKGLKGFCYGLDIVGKAFAKIFSFSDLEVIFFLLKI